MDWRLNLPIPNCSRIPVLSSRHQTNGRAVRYVAPMLLEDENIGSRLSRKYALAESVLAVRWAMNKIILQTVILLAFAFQVGCS